MASSVGRAALPAGRRCFAADKTRIPSHHHHHYLMDDLTNRYSPSAAAAMACVQKWGKYRRYYHHLSVAARPVGARADRMEEGWKHDADATVRRWQL